MQRSQANTDVDARNQDTASTSSTDSIGASMLNRFQALQSSTASGSVASDAEATTSPSEESGHDADMEFARQLQEEEDKIHYERMLQMAGIGALSMILQWHAECCLQAIPVLILVAAHGT